MLDPSAETAKRVSGTSVTTLSLTRFSTPDIGRAIEAHIGVWGCLAGLSLEVIDDALPIRLGVQRLKPSRGKTANGGEVVGLDAGGEQTDLSQLGLPQKLHDHVGAVTSYAQRGIDHIGDAGRGDRDHRDDTPTGFASLL